MNIKRPIVAIAATLLAASVYAQTTGQPLNLTLPPPGSLPASSSTSANATSTSSTAASGSATTASATQAKSSNANSASTHPTGANPASINTTPGVYYGDTSGATSNSTASDAPACDDSTYNQAQMHGSVSTGVASGSHIGTGMWNAGEVNVSKAFGSCDHPTGGVSVSVGVGTANGFHGHGI